MAEMELAKLLVKMSVESSERMRKTKAEWKWGIHEARGWRWRKDKAK